MDIDVFREFDFSGSPNVYGGLVFSIRRRGTYWVFDFFVRELQEGRRPAIRITMEPDINHEMPHIHLSKPHKPHFASISISGQIIHGEVLLNHDEKTAIIDWVQSHSVTLKELWDCAKGGYSDYQRYVERVRNTWEYMGVVYEGTQPKNCETIDGITVWYDGSLSKTFDGQITSIRSSGEMCVYCPLEEKFVVSHYRFSSDCGEPQIRFCSRV